MLGSVRWVLFYWLLLTFVLTGLFWLDVSLFWLLPLLFVFYFSGSWLLTVPAGACPLRWWPIAGWSVLLCVAHLYCLMLLLKVFLYLPLSLTGPVLAGSIGALMGLLLRRHYRFRRCYCKLAGHSSQNIANSTSIPYTGINGFPAFISHLPGLSSVVARSFGWKSRSLHIDNSWTLEMVCTGKSLVSLPHFSYGAVYYHGTSSLESFEELRGLLRQMHTNKGIHGLEVRSVNPSFQNNITKVVSYLPLQHTYEKQLTGFRANLRRKINRGKRHGFSIDFGGSELLNDFYDAYARRLHQLGSGALPRRFFAQLLEQYGPSQAVVFVLKKQDKVVGGAFNLHYQGFYENAWFASLKAVQGQYASYVLHDAMIAHAISVGCRFYSFGRSTRGEGVHRFKSQWGCSELNLQRELFPGSGVDLRKHRWLSVFWRMLPYQLARPLGTVIAKWMY